MDKTSENEAVINERYIVCSTLGQGGMGKVLLCRDTWSDDRLVALKKMRQDRMDRVETANLRAEFLSVARLHHPNLARAYDFGRDWESGDYFFTSEYVDGAHLDAGLPDRNPGTLCAALAEVCRGMEFIHNHGFVHGDIKPENLLLARPKPAPDDAAPADHNACCRVKLIDFGLTIHERAFTGKKIVGTAYYIAPEAILGAMLDRRTDLYSLGVVFYRLAAGRLPFTGQSNIEILKGHLDRKPPAPQDIAPGVPPALGNLIMRLLSKKPGNRPSTAAEIIAILTEITGTDYAIETPESARGYVDSPPFVGRAEPMQVLQAMVLKALSLASTTTAPGEIFPPLANETTLTDRTGIVVVQGEEGVGTSRILDELKLYSETRGALVMSLPRDGVAARLAGWLKVPPDPIKVLQKLRALIARQPLLLLCRGYGECSEEAAAFLRAFARFRAMAQDDMPCLACLSVSTERRNTPITQLLMLEDVRHTLATVAIDRLPQKDIVEIVDATFPENRFSAHFIESVAAESDGCPGSTLAILRTLLDENRLKRETSGWTATIESLHGLALPASGRRHIEERIQGLSDAARRLGADASVLTGPFTLDVLAKLTDIPPGGILEALTELKRKALINALNDRFTFASRTARDILYDTLSEERRRRQHLAAAELLAATDAPAAEKFHHFYHAGDEAHALAEGLEGARELRARWQLAEALDILTKLSSLAGWRAADPCAEQLLAEILMLLGRTRDADRSLAKLAKRSGLPSRILLATIAMRAEIKIKLGQISEAGRLLDQGLKSARDAGDMETASHLLYLAGVLFEARGEYRQSLKATARALRTTHGKDMKSLRWRLCLLRAESFMRLGKNEDALLAVGHALEVLDDRRDVGHMAASLRCLAAFWRYRNHPAKSIVQLHICRSAVERLHLRNDEAECLTELASLHLDRGEILTARHLLRLALKHLETTGNRTQLLRVRTLLAESAWMAGYYEEAKSHGNEAIRICQTFRNGPAQVHAQTVLARVAMDQADPESARKLLVAALRNAHHAAAIRVIRLTEAYASCLCGRWGRVWRLLAGPLADGTSFHPEGTVLLALAAAAMGKVKELETLQQGLQRTAAQEELSLIEAVNSLIAGLIQMCRHEGDFGLARFHKALQLGRSSRADRLVTWVCLYLGKALALNGQYERALLMLEEGLFMAKRLNLALLKGYLWCEMGLLEAQVTGGDLERGMKHVKMAHAVARRSRLDEVLAITCVAAAQLHAKSGRFAEARQHYQEGLAALQLLHDGSKEEPSEHALLFRQLAAAREDAGRMQKLACCPQSEPQGFYGLLGRSDAMQEVFKKISALGPAARWVWVIGGQGAGKTATATAIHRCLNRCHDRIQYVECVALSAENMMEVVAGAKTASSRTLVLEEISNLQPAVQEPLCRMLREQPITVVATTCYALDELGETGVLRADVLAATHPRIALAPLAARPEDIDILAAHYLRARCPDGAHHQPLALAPEALEFLHRYPWPRNVQELVEFCATAYTFVANGKVIPEGLARAILAPTKTCAR